MEAGMRAAKHHEEAEGAGERNRGRQAPGEW